jgi:HSP20 family protein
MAKAKETQEATPQPPSQGERKGGEQPSQAAQKRGGERQTDLQRRGPSAPSVWAGPYGGSPFGLMNRFAEEMDRLFEDFGMGRSWLAPRFGREFGPRGEMGQALWSPQIEVFEREGQLVVRADLPGLNKDDIKVDITDDALTIQGERKQEHEEKREGYYRSEHSYGSFYRSIPLPEGVNAEEAKANFRDGVLEITIPAPQREQRRRQLEIK